MDLLSPTYLVVALLATLVAYRLFRRTARRILKTLVVAALLLAGYLLMLA